MAREAEATLPRTAKQRARTGSGAQRCMTRFAAVVFAVLPTPSSTKRKTTAGIDGMSPHAIVPRPRTSWPVR